MSDQYTGAERRIAENGNDKLILYRLDKVEESIVKIQNKTDNISNDLVVVKNEISHIAKESGKTSGTISGVATGIVMGIIGLVIQGLSK